MPSGGGVTSESTGNGDMAIRRIPVNPASLRPVTQAVIRIRLDLVGLKYAAEILGYSWRPIIHLWEHLKSPRDPTGAVPRVLGVPRVPSTRSSQTAKSKTLGTQLSVAPSRRTASSTSVSNTVRPAAFFERSNTHRPVPRGSGIANLASNSPQTSFWAGVGSSGSMARTPGDTLNLEQHADTGRASVPDPLQISLNAFSELNDQLNYIQDHDEHADIASGDQIIDESLVDDVTDNAESNAQVAEAETRSSQPIKDSIIHKQLVALQQRLMREETQHGAPDCYHRGDFYDRPPHPVFALRDSKTTTGLDPSQLYLRDVFIWLPHLLPGCPDRLKCTRGQPLSKNGSPDDPIARRVRDMPSDFFLFTKRYICDPRRMNSPGKHFQMLNTFASRFGPAPFSELVSEIQHRSHADGELMYLAAAEFYGQHGVKSYSAFNDPMGYSGSPPSVKYLKALFTDYLTAHRIFIERDIGTLPAEIIKGDHTFDSLAFVKDMFEGIQQGLKDNKHPPTQILYTDSPQSERTFHEAINSALCKDVEQVTAWSDLPPFIRDSQILAATLCESVEISNSASDILQDIIAPTVSSQLLLVAVAIKAEQRIGKPPRLDIIQLRTKDRIYVFKVTALNSRSHVLPSLVAIFTNPSILKIGHCIEQALRNISDAFALPELDKMLKTRTPPFPMLELGRYAKLKGAVEEPSLSLPALAGAVLQKSLSAIHSLHQQTIEWIFNHGRLAVVTTSQLHTRGECPPMPSTALARARAVSAPPGIYDDTEFTLMHPAAQSGASSDSLEFEHWSMDVDSDLESEYSEDSESDTDEYGELADFRVREVIILIVPQPTCVINKFDRTLVRFQEWTMTY
ncbi:hypothetical protein DFH07DRAFT_944774 [Mycena maculata]|uniref:3'-5' exonuclease domain-containing protein n=1 Tax=Mycena maculata TaxID=230809 RepID=A0AAD7I304_9AGAR|nr:hypothetical protein DFH07DRAFT_944774 [Mycena maculata]